MRSGSRWSLLMLLLAACTRVGMPAASPEPATGVPSREAPTTRRPPAEPTPTAAAPERPVPRFGEVRALWVVRTTLTSPEKIREMVERAQRAGFNTLLVQVRGRADAYYQSTLEPRAEQLSDQPTSFDPLDLVLEEAHARGLAVHAWVDAFLVWGSGGIPTDPTHLVRSEPELLALPRSLAPWLLTMPPDDPRYLQALLGNAAENRDRVEGIFASPSSPAVQNHLSLVIHEMLERYELDGIHLDYIRYPSEEYDYSGRTLATFRASALPGLSTARAAELDRAARGDPMAWPKALPGRWDEFRRESVTRAVARVSTEARATRPGLVVSAAVFPDAGQAFQTRFQDWVSWARDGLVDVVVPMAYTSEDSLFRAQVGEAVRRVGAGRVWAGIGAWQNTPRGTVSKIALARELGTRGFSLFSYDWAAEQSWGGAPFLERVLEGG